MRNPWKEAPVKEVSVSCVSPLATDDAFWRHLTLATLSVSAIHFEDRFCASRKGGTGRGGWVYPSWWQCLAAVEKPWSVPGGPFVCCLVQMGKNPINGQQT